MYRFELWFSLGIFPGVGLLGHIGATFKFYNLTQMLPIASSHHLLHPSSGLVATWKQMRGNKWLYFTSSWWLAEVWMEDYLIVYCYLIELNSLLGFPGSSAGEESACAVLSLSWSCGGEGGQKWCWNTALTLVLCLLNCSCLQSY